MRRKMIPFGMTRICIPIVISLVLCFAAQGLAQGLARKKAEAAPQRESKQVISQAPAAGEADPAKKPVALTSFGIAEPQDAEAFFQEARKLAPADPAGASRMYQRGIMIKPDAWVERRELAALYEKQGKWNLALAEYEAINKATGSAESFTDVVRTLDKDGYPRAAAAAALKAFAKYPGQPQFLFQTGELFLKSGAEDDAAAALQEYAKLRPKEGRAFFLLGSMHEKAGRYSDALGAYLRAEKLMKDDRDTVDALKRIRSNAATIEGLTIFLPAGWSVEKDGVVNIQGGERVTVTVKASGKPADLVLSAALETMPPELFTAQNRKIHGQSRKLREEMAKIDPEAAKQMEAMPLPFYSTDDFPSIKGAKKALLSTSESVQPGMESAAAIAVPKGGKIYIFLWRAAQPAADGEKMLTQLLGQTVWPL
ncbi:MAG: hypothetical protein C0394_01705 [Syntrophus sp. (in: bacteria)]|nr:hypothetical protein [Syntrophus sp. (in: bacteria)]